MIFLNLRPQIKRDYPLNLSILISGGRESNCDSLSSGERSGKSSDLKSGPGIRVRIVAFGCTIAVVLIRGVSSLEWDAREGESPVHHRSTLRQSFVLLRVGLFGIAALNLWGGRSLPKLNIGGRPIANKYREGKVKRTLKRELKAFEIVKREANGTEMRRAFFLRRVGLYCIS
jgi:hypothetical protein